MTEIASLENVNLTLTSDAGPVAVLQDVTLSLPAGKTVSIMGPSGSGKTSLLMILGGLEKASSGHVTVAATRLDDLSQDALAAFRRDNVGIVFQNFHLMPSMNALENVAVPLEFAGVKDAFARAEEALGQVGLKDRILHYPAQLSGGEQQRVAIARAFAPRPRLILADEPTGNLDAATGQKIMDMLFDLARKNQSTLVLVTHDADLAARTDQIIRIRDGKIAA